MSLLGLVQVLKGGSGSGNFDHEGIPGKVGGSVSSKFTGDIGAGREQDLANITKIRKALQYGDPKLQRKAESASDAIKSRVTMMINGARSRNMLNKSQVTEYKKIIASQKSAIQSLENTGGFRLNDLDTSEKFLNLLYDVQESKK